MACVVGISVGQNDLIAIYIYILFNFNLHTLEAGFGNELSPTCISNQVIIATSRRKSSNSSDAVKAFTLSLPFTVYRLYVFVVCQVLTFVSVL
jgi:hypothetical protein